MIAKSAEGVNLGIYKKDTGTHEFLMLGARPVSLQVCQRSHAIAGLY
jgi:hypothetical protein